VEKRTRDPVSGLIHLVASAFAVAGLVWLYQLSSGRSATHLASVAVFGVSMVLLYLASSLYHLMPATDPQALKLKRLDHSMIYVFIAGCYTPVCLIALRGALGTGLLAVVWTFAIIGVVIKLVFMESSRWLRIGPYLALGWMSVMIMPRLYELFPARGLVLLCAGGGAYTVGSIVYATKRPDPIPSILGFHEIWHVFVIVGTACHFWLMKDHVLTL
jgi:hemolysin III